MIKLKHILSERMAPSTAAFLSGELKIKKGYTIVYDRQFRFGKVSKDEKAKVVAINKHKVLLDNGQELDLRKDPINKVIKEGNLTERFDKLPDVSFKRLARPPKRFTVKQDFTADGTNYSKGDYALKKKRAGGGIYLNMDKGEMLGIDTDTIAKMQKADYGIYEGKLNEASSLLVHKEGLFELHRTQRNGKKTYIVILKGKELGSYPPGPREQQIIAIFKNDVNSRFHSKSKKVRWDEGNVNEQHVPKRYSSKATRAIQSVAQKFGSNNALKLLGLLAATPLAPPAIAAYLSSKVYSGANAAADAVPKLHKEGKLTENKKYKKGQTVQYQLDKGSPKALKPSTGTISKVKKVGTSFQYTIQDGGPVPVWGAEIIGLAEGKLNEAKFYITYNKGRGQGKALLKSSASNWKRPQVFNSYKDAEKYIGNENKVGMTAYWVSDDKMNRVNKYGEIKESSGMIKLKDIWSD